MQAAVFPLQLLGYGFQFERLKQSHTHSPHFHADFLDKSAGNKRANSLYIESRIL
jgi:hypothetical protein